MKRLLLPAIVLLFIASCDKVSIDENNTGQVYAKYVGNHSASGTQVRYRTGIDTTTSVDTFRMNIIKSTDASVDSVLRESRLTIQNFLGTTKTVAANATYSKIVAFTATTLPSIKQLQLISESKSILKYSYYKVNSIGDTSWYSGSAVKQ